MAKHKKRAFGVQYHGQAPMLNYIIDFYCNEIGLTIQIEGKNYE